MAILEVKNLSKNFGELKVLRDISFNVEQGQAVSIIGPSGSGKSTLLRCVNQLERADGGEINVCGMNMIKTENGKAIYAPSKTLREIRLKKDILICAIIRKRQVIIPNGNDTIELDDSVVIVTKEHRFTDLKDILD